jgi:ribose 1,5-bisphosphokinase PhnN
MPSAPAQPARSVLDNIEHGATLAAKGSRSHLTKGRRSYALRSVVVVMAVSLVKKPHIIISLSMPPNRKCRT